MSRIGDKMTCEAPVKFDKYLDVKEMTAPAAPDTNVGRLYVADSGGTTKLYFKDSAGTATDLIASSGNTLDAAYDQGGAGSGKAITVDSGAIALSNTGANNNGLLTVNKTPVGSQSGDLVTITAGANCTGDALQFANSGSGNDIAGSGGTWSVTKLGVATLAGATVTGAIDLTGGVIAGASPLVFEGNTANEFETTLAVTDPTADRTITLPDASGTVDLIASTSHNYAGAHADWTLTVDEQRASYITVTNADAGANMILSAAIPGKIWFVYNNSGQTLTFKVTGQTGQTLATSKRGLYVSDAVDIYEIWQES